jgi:7,8-dihydropterin-6-yl-methyl-4-(beta-D-ribofuranosyl)aminobenzene 5'-phosphate synthase
MIRVSRIIRNFHPGMARGPLYDKVFGALPDDPSFQEIESAGGVIEKHAEGHAVAGGGVWVSGEIPRVTSFEGGIPGAMRWVAEDGGKWIKDEVRLHCSVRKFIH